MALYRIMRTCIVEGPPGAFPDDPMEPMIPEAMLCAINAGAIEAQLVAEGHAPDCEGPDMLIEMRERSGPYRAIVTDEITGMQFAPTEVFCNNCHGSRRIHNEWGQLSVAAGNGWHEFTPCCSGAGAHHYNIPVRA